MKHIAHFLIMIFMAGIFSSCTCTSTTRKSFSESSKGQSELYRILYYASLAGNSHNTQPWLVELIGDSVLLVKADTIRKLHAVDPSGRGLFISLGAFIENISLASGNFGYAADIRITARDNADVLAAEVRFLPFEGDVHSLKELEERQTLRIPFETRDIIPDDVRTLIGENDQSVYFFPASSERGKYIGQKMLDAYAQQANRNDAKEELAHWMRFSNKDVKDKRDGLSTSGMGIKGFGGFMVRNFFKPNDSKKQSFIDKGIEKTKKQVDHCGGWIVITQPEDTPRAWLTTGRIYQRINLKCRSLMIGFHPMNPMVEEPNYEVEVNEFLGLPGRIQFVARVGYVSEYPDAISVRRPVEDFLIAR